MKASITARPSASLTSVPVGYVSAPVKGTTYPVRVQAPATPDEVRQLRERWAKPER